MLQGVQHLRRRRGSRPGGEEAVTSILTNTKDLTRNLNNVIVSNEAALRAALENTRQLTGNLNRVVTQNDEKVGQVMDTLKSASRERDGKDLCRAE